MLQATWSDPRVGLTITVLVAIAAALVSAWLIPRGPITTTQAIVSMVAALAVGMVAGAALGSRWSLLITPAVFMVAYEIARNEMRGPTVDGVQLGSMYGVIAFVVGRGLHGLLVLVPMVLGARFGVEIAARLGHAGAGTMGIIGWIPTGLVTIGMAALLVVLATPPSTSPVAGPDGAAQPGSIAELTSTEIGGHEQALMIRGRSTDNPVLLYLAGGPGGTDLGAMRLDTSLEDRFVVVTWEQRGVGKSYQALDPLDTFTLDRMVADTIELTDHLRARFGEDRIYLAGNSWGTILGVLAVRERPELYHAYVGIGQMVNLPETDRMFWEDTITWAEQTGDMALATKLLEMGPPPYADLLQYEPAVGHEHDWNAYPELDFDNEMPAILFVPENSLMDRFNGFRSFLDTFSAMYPQIQALDFRRDASTLEVPVYMVLGEHEARGRAQPANEWFDGLQAQVKERVIIPGAGHRAHFDQPGAFAALMDRVVDATYPMGTGAVR